MENITLPSKIQVTAGKDKNSAEITIFPCHPGYGITLGNALRRVLLSSLPGAAVTAFKLKNAPHEFTTISGVKEDIVEVTLNLKQLRIKVHTDEPVKLELKSKGQKDLKAKEIKAPSSVEIINPDLTIATLTDKDAEVEMELLVAQGRGYVPVEEVDKEALEVGMIAIDSIFTPVKNVAFKVENIRVGDITNFEKLILTIETDGTINPKTALEQATNILTDHFNFIIENSGGTKEEPKTKLVTTETTQELTEEAVKGDEEKPAEAPEIEDKPKKKRGRPKKEVKE